jgi:hypothetical protein
MVGSLSVDVTTIPHVGVTVNPLEEKLSRRLKLGLEYGIITGNSRGIHRPAE